MATGNGKPGPTYTIPDSIPPNKQLLDVGEVGLLLGVEEHTVRRYYRLHGLPSYRRGPHGPRVFDRFAVVAWWRAFLTSPTGQAENRRVRR